MELESHFEFLSPEVIRIKGTRVDIEIVIEDDLGTSGAGRQGHHKRGRAKPP